MNWRETLHDIRGMRTQSPLSEAAFTRQHYNEVAAILKNNKPTSGSIASWQKMVDEFSTLFVRDNPNFKPDLFAKAVGR